MITEAPIAYLLHQSPSGDTSARLTVFTRDKGLFSCLYKGGRTPKKKALLQPFLPLWLDIHSRQDWHYARQVEALGPPFLLTGEALFAGLYMNELLYYALLPQDAYPQLFDQYQHTLAGLAAGCDKRDMQLLLRQFEWELLSACGYAVSYTHEAYSGIPIQEQQYYQFHVEGFLPAKQGIMGWQIIALGKGDFSDNKTLSLAKRIMRQAIDHLLNGKPLKSRALFLAHKSLNDTVE